MMLQLGKRVVGSFSARFITQTAAASAFLAALLLTPSAAYAQSCTNNQLPSANAGADRSGVVLESFTFTGSGSDPDGSIIQYWWNFGDGAFTGWQNSPSATHSYLNSGSYSARLWVKDNCNAFGQADIAIMNISASPNGCNGNQAPIANAGPDIAQDGIGGTWVSFSAALSSDAGGLIANYQWNFGDGQSASSANSASSHYYATPGIYNVSLTVTDNCNASSSDSLIVRLNNHPTVNAGLDQTITLPSAANLAGIASDDGLPLGSVLSLNWSKASGPGSVTFSNPSSLNATANFSAAGSYLLRLRANDGESEVYDDVLITVNAQNLPPSVEAGLNRSIFLPNAASLAGVASDANGLASTLWSKTSGPGSVTFVNPNALTTTASVSIAGSYVLRLTATDITGQQAFDEMTLTASPANCANNAIPVANAGPMRYGVLNVPMSFTFSGFDSNGQIASYAAAFPFSSWTPYQSSSTFQFTPTFVGTGTLQVRVKDDCGANSGVASVLMTVAPAAGSNMGPMVDAGPASISVQSIANLDGTVVDDGLPVGSTPIPTWSKSSGPGTVSFSPSANSIDCTATFSVPGSYMLRLNATDGQVTCQSDYITVIVSSGNPVNQAPAVSAGADQSITMPLNGSANVNLTGSASDDGLPAGSTLTKSWSKLSGPGTVSFANSSSAVTSASISAPGSYLLRLTANDSVLSASDDIAITVNPNACAGNQNPISNAGPDKTGTVGVALSFSGSLSSDPNGTIQSYSWNFGDGTSGSGVSVSKTYTVAGNYTVTLTVTDICNASHSDTASATIQNANQAPLVNAGPDQLNLTMPLSGNASVNLAGSASDDGLPAGSTLTKTWSKLSGPGAVSFSNASSPITTASISLAGNYVLRLSASDGSLTSSDDISITINANTCAGNTPPTANAGPDKTANVGAVVSFSGAASSDPGGSIASYSWNFGDGSSANGLSVSHSYAAAGNFTVSLSVTDNCGSVSSDGAIVTVSAGTGPLQANFKVFELMSVSPSGVESWREVDLLNEFLEVGLKYKFDSSSSTGPVALAAWEGAFYSVESAPYLAISFSGQYPLTLHVYNASYDQEHTITKTIRMASPMMTGVSQMPSGQNNENLSVQVHAIDENHRLWTIFGPNPIAGGLAVTNLSNPASLTAFQIAYTGSNISLAGLQGALAAADGNLYTAENSVGVRIFRADPNNVALLGQITSAQMEGALAKHVVAKNHMLYVGTSAPYQLRAYDVTNPAAPVLKKTLPLSSISELKIAGNGIVMSSGSSLLAFDIQNPQDPILAQTLSFPMNVTNIRISGNRLLVQVLNYPSSQFSLLDLETPSGAGSLVQFTTPKTFEMLLTQGGASLLLFDGKRLYTNTSTSQFPGYQQIFKYDLTNPNNVYVMTSGVFQTNLRLFHDSTPDAPGGAYLYSKMSMPFGLASLTP